MEARAEVSARLPGIYTRGIGFMLSPTESDFEFVRRCLICDAFESRGFLSVSGWELRQCVACGLVYTSPRLNQAALAAIYAQGYYEGTEDYFRSQSIPASEDQLAIARSARRRVRIAHPTSLDVGTGAGRIVEAFDRSGFHAIGIEPSEAACAVAQKLGRNVSQSPLQEVESDSYDCVTLFHVLEHIGDPIPFLEQIHRVTRHEGILIVEVPNIESHSAITMGAAWPHLYPDTHLAHYSPSSLSAALRRTGFKVERVQRVGGAGLFTGHTPSSNATPQASTQSPSQADQIAARTKSTVRSVLWANRQGILSIPGVRGLARWLNWEVLGLGHFVRIRARKI